MGQRVVAIGPAATAHEPAEAAEGKARSTVRHLRANASSPEVTIIAVDGQSTQETMPR